MEEIASLWSYQQNVDELKQRLMYTTLELEAVKAENDEEMKRNRESMKRLLQSLKIVCQERDEAKDQLQKLLNKTMPSNDQQVFKIMNPLIPNCFDRVRQHHQGQLMMPAKANSSISESNSVNHSSSPVDSLFDPIVSPPEFSNINVDTPFVQDYDQNGGFCSNSLNGLVNQNVQKVDQATLVMEGMIKGKTLPQKGNLLEAVVEAGPLLETLLLAGPLPKWQNPPSLNKCHIPSMVASVDQISVAQKLDVGNEDKLSKSPMMMLKQSQPYAKMACGSSSQMMAGGGSGGVLSYGAVNFGGNFQGRMVAACPSASNLGTIAKKQRLH
ncbi:hypothetical protein M8C21_001022 [Ambrosia artemisiifolia]|uniref:Uncharacterized protein n=1 Tax=Ambrosia artemisiifolia TaxID=4212 RepID=A0AAD5GEM0_AMBAR|nr:hypothetical protein M8C21_001022 [Ambrosia artemisiifolia]